MINYLIFSVPIVILVLGYWYIRRRFSDITKKTIDSLVYIHSHEGIFISDDTGKILSVNPAFERLTGYSAAELVNKDIEDVGHDIRSREFYNVLKQSLEEKQNWEGEISDCHKDGSLFFKWLKIDMIQDETNQTKYIGTFSDMNKIEEANQKLWYQANFDKVTDLPNRNMFFDHLKQQMDKAKRYGQQMALLYLDLTNFEEINNEFGHTYGDQVLKEAAERIAGCIRDVDLLYRIGGVEFTIILPNIEEIDKIDDIGKKIITAMSSPFTINKSKSFYIYINIGITVSDDNDHTPEILLQRADRAMYSSKKDGRNSMSHFRNSMNEPSYE